MNVRTLPFLEKKIDATKELVSAGVSCGKLFCRPFDIINSAANEIKSLHAQEKHKQIL